MINKWPYNCIRQFRAEDETGKFSFVSGRRGPYGVAEYNFSLPNNSLGTLQNALTNFTGAQFSSVAPGSGAEQQQPLQPFPPTLPRQTFSVSSNAYQTSTPKHAGAGGIRKESTTLTASYPDSVFSPVHSHQLPIPGTPTSSSSPAARPRLPPRDYSLTQTYLPSFPSGPSDHSGPLSISMDETMLRLQGKARAMTSASATSSSSVDTGGLSETPPSLPPRRGSHERSPETWIAQSTCYEGVEIENRQSTKSNRLSKSGAVESGAMAPPILPKKKLFDRLKEATGTGPVMGSEVTKEAEISSSKL